LVEPELYSGCTGRIVGYLSEVMNDTADFFAPMPVPHVGREWKVNASPSLSFASETGFRKAVREVEFAMSPAYC
jgi:hypothetical protein